MKRIIIWFLIIAGVIVALDVAFGFAFGKYMDSHTLPGDYEMTDHVLRGFDEEGIVLGSSVALNSINTKTLQDSLGMTFFNGGANGQTFPFYLTMLKAVTEQKSPKKVLLALTPENLDGTALGDRYNFLSPYYGRGIADIDERMENGELSERVFLKSNFYRLNRIWFRIMLYNFMSAGIKGENGTIVKPLPSSFPPRRAFQGDFRMTPERRKDFEEFLKICRDKEIDLTVLFTPQYTEKHPKPLTAVREAEALCRRYGARFFDDTLMEPFNSDSTLYYDDIHVNLNGTKIYTDTIISRLR